MKTFPLLQGQVEVWSAWMTNPASVAYNLPAVVPFLQDIDLDRLSQALQKIWEQRRELHTQFTISANGEPRQWADDSLSLPLVRRKMTEKDAQSYIHCGFVRPFAVSAGQPFVRFEIVETEAHHYLLYDVHHLIGDGLTLSRAFLSKDLPAAYAGEPLTPQEYGLFQHAEAEEEMMHSDRYKHDALFYQQELKGVDFTSLSTQVASPWGRRIGATESVDAAAIDEWCQQQGVTHNLFFMTAFALVLSRLSGEAQVAFACLNHGRSDHRLADAYGMFVCSVPVLARVEEEQSVKDLMGQLRRWLISTVRHRAYPLTHLCHDLHKMPAATFAFQGSDILEQTTTGGRVTVGYQLMQGTTQNDLSCTIYAKEGRYEIRMEVSEARWSEARLQRMAHATATCTENLMSHINHPLADIDIVTSAQKQELLQLGQGERLDYDHSQTFVSLFLRQAKRTPDALAVTDGTTSLTYAELNQRSAALATLLMTERNVKPGDHVVIATGQSTPFLVAAIAVERIGAAYVPVEAEWPESRKRDIMEDAQAATIIDGTEDLASIISTDIYQNRAVPHQLAYIIYTSGTTGHPKGVMISHRAKLNLLHSIVHLWHLTSESRISCHSSVAFDASVEDLFPVLTVGGSVHIMPERIRRDLHKIHQFLTDHHITGGCYTTHLGVMLAERFPLPMQYLCLGGERLTSLPHTQPRVFNTYGPTEFTVDATYSEGSTSIGRPFPNLSAYIVDAHCHLLPKGEVGELCLSGIQMAEGYWNRPELTAQTFVHSPHLPEKVYLTGDLARWNENGMLEYIGRKDRQLKLHGYRIEPEELEQQLMKVTGIQQVAIVLRSVNGIDRLCAYFTADAPMPSSHLTEQLSQTFPPYMMPDFFCQLPQMPLTAAGKIDYPSLPTPTPQQHHEPPVNEAERLWCHLFEQVTGVPHVGATDNFFHIGGTSILATSLMAEAERQGIHLSYGDVFMHPTPRGLASGKTLSPTVLPHNGESHLDRSSSGNSPHGLPPHYGGVLGRGSSKGLLPLFLTGATGLLGSHILHEYLLSQTGDVHCLVRADNKQHALSRLTQALQEQTGMHLTHELAQRIIPVVGDLLSLTPDQLPSSIHTVIHCAADVRHFAADDAIEKTNLVGTDRIISCCITRQARLIHISTLGIDPASPNPYIRSKSIAEQHVLEAIRQGELSGTVMRIGNLTNTPQPHSTLQDTLLALLQLGQYPQSLASIPIALSTADATARAILLLATHATGHPLLAPYNPQTTTLASLLPSSLQSVPDSLFRQTLTQALTTPANRALLTPLLHYLDIIDTTAEATILTDNTLTNRLLQELDFHW